MDYPAKTVDVVRWAFPGYLGHRWPLPAWKILGSEVSSSQTAAEAEFVILNEDEVRLTELG